ncbi:MAG: NAD-dependent epimerase/dehydratase family protein [Alsobacter sp.]
MTGRARVLLTGATGFVGRHLARSLLSEGYAVRAPARRPDGLPAGVEPAALDDLSAPQDWAALLDGIDSVVHSAGLAHAGPGLPEDAYERVNRDATLALGRAAAGTVRRFVFLSSIRAQCGPSSATVLRETDEPRPTDAYGRSKLAAEQGLAALDIEAVSLRPVVVYGPGVGGNVGQLVRLARMPLPLPFGALQTRRSLVCVENLASAVSLALSPGGLPAGPLIVADPQPIAFAELVAAMREALGRPRLLVDMPPGLMQAALGAVGAGGIMQRLAGEMVADPSRLLSLGWQPPVRSTQAGIRRWLGAPTA